MANKKDHFERRIGSELQTKNTPLQMIPTKNSTPTFHSLEDVSRLVEYSGDEGTVTVLPARKQKEQGPTIGVTTFSNARK